MIKANEIRIGNWLHGIGLIKGYIQVTGISLFWESTIYFNNIAYSMGNIEGIPLTPEILEKCGFVKSVDPNGGPMFSGHELLFLHEGDDYTLFSTDTYENEIDRIGKSFQYVHQLQNIYFALTGENLNIQP